MPEDPHAVLARDPVMADLIEEHGRITVDPADEEFQRLVVSIVNQQLSTASAAAIRERLFDRYDGPLTPEVVLATPDAELRETGLSRSKVEYVNEAAEAFRRRDLTRSGLSDLSDEEVVDELASIRGVGTWTARMYLLFVLGREDVFPLGDLGIRNGLEELYGDGDSLSRERMRDIASRWAPYRSYGTRYVWAAYESD